MVARIQSVIKSLSSSASSSSSTSVHFLPSSLIRRTAIASPSLSPASLFTLLEFSGAALY